MDFCIKNVMETLVLQKLDDVIERVDCCRCNKCRMDVAAYALNHLAPKYVASLQGELFIKVDALTQQHAADVTTAVTAAAQLVKERPQH